jgi:hypothetical protein
MTKDCFIFTQSSYTLPKNDTTNPFHSSNFKNEPPCSISSATLFERYVDNILDEDSDIKSIIEYSEEHEDTELFNESLVDFDKENNQLEIPLHNTINHNTINHNTINHNTINHNTINHNTINHNTTNHNTINHNTINHNTINHNSSQLVDMTTLLGHLPKLQTFDKIQWMNSNSSNPVSQPTRNTIPSTPSDHCIIIDWDDTLFPTSYIYHLTMSHPDPLLFKKELYAYENVLISFFEIIMKMGNIFIVTNSEDGWVYNTCQKHLPRIWKYVSQTQLISARTLFGYQYPTQPYMWKHLAFTECLNNPCYKYLLSFGDNPMDHQAAITVGSRLKHKIVKTVRFQLQPTLSILRTEMIHITRHLVKIISCKEDLDVSWMNSRFIFMYDDDSNHSDYSEHSNHSNRSSRSECSDMVNSNCSSDSIVTICNISDDDLYCD